MSELDTINKIRGLGFFAGIVERQGREPLCSKCISYALSLEVARQALAGVKDTKEAGDFEGVLREAAEIINSAKVAEEPIKQRKVSACQLPDKACFVKKSRRLFLAESD